MMNSYKIQNNCCTLLSGLLLTSCKQTILINEAVLVDEPATKTDLYGFIKDSLIDWRFGIWFTVFLLLALVIWKKGNSILEWYKHKPMSSKVLIAMVVLAVIFIFGCIPGAYNSQEYGGWFALPVMMTIGTFLAICINLFKRIRTGFDSTEKLKHIPNNVRRQHNLRLLALFIAWIWSCGWILYFIAIGVAYKPHVGSEVFMRSALASINLFVMNIDSNIIDSIWSHDVLKGMICSAGFAATLCTVILIMLLVVYRLMAYLHISNLVINDQRNHLYVFFDMCDASKLLAQSIYNEDEKSVVVFVANAMSNKTEYEDDKTESWRSVLDILSFRRKTIQDIEENERRAIAVASSDICSVDAEEKDVLGNIGLETVKKLMRKLDGIKDAQLHVFLLSEDRDTNVRSTSILVRDEMIGCSGVNTTLYCHARRDGVNRILEEMGLSAEKEINVKILDSAHLAMEYLKCDVKNHPINFVDINKIDNDNPGSVSSEFVSLVMGFSETGQEAVKFLYEYGAFVDKKATEDKSYRSKFSCHVVDCNMKKLEGEFIASAPSVNYVKSSDVKKENNKEGAVINFYELDYRSDEFFTEVLEGIAESLNYVVVAIGDDELNMTVAVEILSYVRKKRKNLDNFCIYVRAYEKGPFKHMSEIAKHYNMRLGRTAADDVNKIILFGQNQEIYTFDLIVADMYLEEGKKYYATYRSLQIDPKNDEGTWEERHNKALKPSNKTTKWERLSKIRRKESQDRSNALHSYTKIRILEHAVGKDNAKDFALRALGGRKGRKKDIRYSTLNDKENHLMLNLAMCEHLRWNAAHEMMGYKKNDVENECNELTKSHNCLRPWQELDEESDKVSYIDDYKVYDYGVVETSFKINYEDEQN